MNTSINTLFIGKVLLNFPELASTNSYATDLVAKSNPSEGTVISTDNQTIGRGQIGRFWESEPEKNLTFSLILYPRFLFPARQFLLSQAISLALVDCLELYELPHLKVKWPNDIYVGNRKIAGILIQNVLSSTQVQSSVVGIGLNVNQAVFKSPAPNPTSLFLEKKQNYALDRLFAQLCEALERRYLQLRAGDSKTIEQSYLKLLYRYQELASFQVATTGNTFVGTICGLTSAGKLLIEQNDATVAYGLREIRFL